MWQFWLVTGALFLSQGDQVANLKTQRSWASIGVPQMHTTAGFGAFQAHRSLSMPFWWQPLRQASSE